MRRQDVCVKDKKEIRIGDIVCCRSPDGIRDLLPAGLPNNSRAKVIATYIGATYVLYEGSNYIVPNACVHSGSDDFGTFTPLSTPEGTAPSDV